MKKFFAGTLLAMKLLTQDPNIAHSQTVEFSNITKSNIADTLEMKELQEPKYITLEQAYTKESVFSNLMDEEFQKEILGEIEAGPEGFLGVVEYIADVDLIKDFFIQEILQEMNKAKYPIKFVDQTLVAKYGDNVYKKVSKYFLFTTLKLAIEKSEYKIFSDGTDINFMDLTPELIENFKYLGLDFPENIGDYDNFSFKMNDGKIDMIAFKDKKLVVLTQITIEEVHESFNDIFDVVYQVIELSSGMSKI